MEYPEATLIEMIMFILGSYLLSLVFLTLADKFTRRFK